MAGKYNIQFVADTSQSDSKIKQQIKYIQDLDRNVRKMGGTFEYAEEEDLAFVKSLGQMSSNAMTARGRVKEMSDAINEMRIIYDRMTQGERKAPIGVVMSQSIKEASATLHQYSKELQGIKPNDISGSFAGKMGGLMPMGMGMGIGVFAANATMKAIGAMTNAVKEGVMTNMNFEQSNANLAAVLGTTRGSIKGLTNDAIKYGMQTKFTADQVTELQVSLSRLGFAQKEIRRSTKPILDMATATGETLENSAKLAGSTMRAFGLSASEMERVTSVLAVSTTKSALTTEKLSVGLGYASSVARQAGFSIEGVTAMLGKMSDTGLSASTAGVSVRNILLELNKEGTKLSKAIGHPVRGIEDLCDAIDELKKKGLTTADIANLIDKRVTPAFASLVDNVDGLRKLNDELKDCGEQARKMADEQMDTLQGSTLKMKSAWDALMLSFGNSTGPMKTATDWMTSVISKAAEYRKMMEAINSGDASSFIETVPVKVIDTRLGDYKGKSSEEIEKAETELRKNLEEKRDMYKSLLEKYSKAFNVKSMEDELAGAGIFFMDSKNNRIKTREDVGKELIQSVKYYEDQLELSKAVVERAKEIENEKKKTTEDGAKITGPYQKWLDDIRELKKKIGEYQEALEKVKSSGDADGVVRWNQELEKLYNQLKQLQSGSNDTFAREIESAAEVAVSALDREEMSEVAYMDKVHEIRTKMFNDLADLYERDEKKLADSNKRKAKEDDRYARERVRAVAEQRKRDIELRAEEDIAKIDKMSMSDRDYEKAVNSIRTKSYNDIADSYRSSGMYSRASSYDAKGVESAANGEKIGQISMTHEWLNYSEGIEDTKKKMEQLRDIIRETGDENQRAWATDELRKYAVEIANAGEEMLNLKHFGDSLGEVQGIWSAVEGSVNAVSSAIDTLKDAINGEASAWETITSVIGAAFTVLEGIVTVSEAINTLSAISSAMKSKETAETMAKATAQTEETVAEGASIAMAPAQIAANEGIAESSKQAAMGLMAQANAAIAAAHAPIPIVGPALASAGMATVSGSYAGSLAAAVAATQVLHFAEGGRVPGAYNGGRDTVAALLSPGEIVLNRSMQNNLAGQLQGSAMQQQIVVSGKLHGRDIRLSADRDNRSRGGSRGVYAKVR